VHVIAPGGGGRWKVEGGRRESGCRKGGLRRRRIEGIDECPFLVEGTHRDVAWILAHVYYNNDSNKTTTTTTTTTPAPPPPPTTTKYGVRRFSNPPPTSPPAVAILQNKKKTARRHYYGKFSREKSWGGLVFRFVARERAHSHIKQSQRKSNIRFSGKTALKKKGNIYI